MSLLDALLLEPYRIDIWIAFRLDGIGGSGTQNDPYDGSTWGKFDTIMNSMPASPAVQVHLGPGVFETKGYADILGGWQPRVGMKIVGSGIGVTTIRLTGAVDPTEGTRHYFVIGHALSSTTYDHFEVSDLTIDCNLPAFGSATKIACGAVRLLGNHACARRIKVINWGRNAAGPSAFVVSMLTAYPEAGVTGVINTGIEECIATNPGASANGPVTVLRVGPRDDSGYYIEGSGSSPYIRNCYVEGAGPSASGEIRALSMSWCEGGAVEGNQVRNVKYAGPYATRSSARSLVIRGNVLRNVVKGPFWDFTPLSPSSLTSLVRDGGDPTIAVATTSGAHGLQSGGKVRIDISTGPSLYEGVFVIKDVPSSSTFRYQMAGDPGATGVSSPTFQKVWGCDELLIEANNIELAISNVGEIGIEIGDAGMTPQSPEYVHRAALVRGNRVRFLDGAYNGTWTAVGVVVHGVKDLLVQNNVVVSSQAHPVTHQRCGAAGYLDNLTPGGLLIRGYNGDTGKEYEELETYAEDALLMALGK